MGDSGGSRVSAWYSGIRGIWCQDIPGARMQGAFGESKRILTRCWERGTDSDRNLEDSREGFDVCWNCFRSHWTS